jgi:hypothetical protein
MGDTLSANVMTVLGHEPERMGKRPLYWSAVADRFEELGRDSAVLLCRRKSERCRSALSDLRRRFRFFLANAGGIVGERANIALCLAKAEIWAEGEGVEREWVHNEDGWDADWPDRPEEVFGCILRHPDGTEESLWGIADPTQEYARVVEAELAAQLRDTIRRKGTA